MTTPHRRSVAAHGDDSVASGVDCIVTDERVLVDVMDSVDGVASAFNAALDGVTERGSWARDDVDKDDDVGSRALYRRAVDVECCVWVNVVPAVANVKSAATVVSMLGGRNCTNTHKAVNGSQQRHANA